MKKRAHRARMVIEKGTPIRGAFTLIELLVVIAIIMLLAAILFPVFQTARERARQTSCASNQKQMGLAFLQYAQDFDETMVSGQTSSSASGSQPAGIKGNGWAGQIQGYMKSYGAYACPSDGSAKIQVDVSGSVVVGVGFAYNANLPTVHLAAIQQASRTVLLGEITSNNVNVSSVTESDWAQNHSIIDTGSRLLSMATGTNAAVFLATTKYVTGAYVDATHAPLFVGAPDWRGTPRHNGGANFLFQDGHVKWLTGSSVTASANINSCATLACYNYQ